MEEANRITAYLKVTAEFYDPDATPETVRACVEQDLEDAGYEVGVENFPSPGYVVNEPPTVIFEEKPKWISVKDHLPPPVTKDDDCAEYIVHIVDDEGNWAIGIAEWDYTLGVSTWRLGPESVIIPEGMYVTHWMETPEPPGEPWESP